MKKDKFTNEELQALVLATGVPLLYLMKMNTYGLLNGDRALDVILSSEYARVRSEMKGADTKIKHAVASHYHVSWQRVIAAIRRRRKK